MASLKHELCLISQKYPSVFGRIWVTELVRPWAPPSWFLALALSPSSDRLLAKMSHFTVFAAFFSRQAKSGTSQFQTKKRAKPALLWHLEHNSGFNCLEHRVITTSGCQIKITNWQEAVKMGGPKEKYLERTSDNVKYILGGSHWTEIRCWERPPPPSWGPRRDQLANSELWSSRAFPLRLEPVRPITHLLVLLPPPQQGIP